jgi:hypothetical protein
MGGKKGAKDNKDRSGDWTFAYKEGEDKPWRMVMTMQPALRSSLEEWSHLKYTIMPLVCLSIAGMGVLYSLLTDEMTSRIIPAATNELYNSDTVQIELGLLPWADVVIQMAKQGFQAALEEGGTRHWFVRQLLMALEPINRGLAAFSQKPSPSHAGRGTSRFRASTPARRATAPRAPRRRFSTAVQATAVVRRPLGALYVT